MFPHTVTNEKNEILSHTSDSKRNQFASWLEIENVDIDTRCVCVSKKMPTENSNSSASISKHQFITFTDWWCDWMFINVRVSIHRLSS